SPPRDLIGKMPTVTESPSKPTPISIALLDETDLHPDSDVESQAVESACPFCQRVLSKATLSSHLLSCRKLKVCHQLSIGGWKSCLLMAISFVLAQWRCR